MVLCWRCSPVCPSTRTATFNDKPGLGVDLIEKEAEKYPCENTVTTWTQTRRMDGALQTP